MTPTYALSPPAIRCLFFKPIPSAICRWEAKELDRQLHLAAVDKELHDAINATQEAIEVKSLHEYATLMWTKDAQASRGSTTVRSRNQARC